LKGLSPPTIPKHFNPKTKKIMLNIHKEISILREMLKGNLLTPAERQSILGQIALWESFARL
jgi:hypothetical protein